MRRRIRSEPGGELYDLAKGLSREGEAITLARAQNGVLSARSLSNGSWTNDLTPAGVAP